MQLFAADEGLPSDPREERVRRVLVVGGGSSGWMAAAYLATALSRDINITLIESEAIGTVGVGEATIPPIKQFNRFLRLDEREFIQATQGSFKLGIEFHNWARTGDRYIHQFGSVGREIDTVIKLHHWWLAGRLAGEADYPAFEDLYPAKAIARANRFAMPDPDPQSVLSRFTYAYHFDAGLYGGFLRRIAEARGVTRAEGLIADVEREGESGHVTAVTLDDGRRLEADLFVDCSGFRSLLLGGALEEPFDDWSHWLPADRALAVPSDRVPGALTPYTMSTAHEAGWQWRIPLQHRTGNGHVFSSQFTGEDQATARLLDSLDTPAQRDPLLIRFKTGRRARSWVGNVVAVGLASGFLEPLESTSLHFVQASLERLVDLFPTRHMDSVLRDRFNAQTRIEWERVRDFIIAHYHLTQRTDSEFWRYTANMAIPDSLAEVLALWKERAVVGVEGNHLFQLGSWASVLIGQRFLPGGVHALADRAPPEFAARKIREIAREVEEAAGRLPPHHEWLERNAPAPKD